MKNKHDPTICLDGTAEDIFVSEIIPFLVEKFGVRDTQTTHYRLSTDP